jgi:hypothetical protein
MPRNVIYIRDRSGRCWPARICDEDSIARMQCHRKAHRNSKEHWQGAAQSQGAAGQGAAQGAARQGASHADGVSMGGVRESAGRTPSGACEMSRVRRRCVLFPNLKSALGSFGCASPTRPQLVPAARPPVRHDRAARVGTSSCSATVKPSHERRVLLTCNSCFSLAQFLQHK